MTDDRPDVPHGTFYVGAAEHGCCNEASVFRRDRNARVMDDRVAEFLDEKDAHAYAAWRNSLATPNDLFRETTPEDGVINLQKWPEGYMLWYHGRCVWRSERD